MAQVTFTNTKTKKKVGATAGTGGKVAAVIDDTNVEPGVSYTTTYTGRGATTRKSGSAPASVTFSGQGEGNKNVTLYGEAAKKVPESVLQSPNVSSMTQQEMQNLPAYQPFDKEALFDEAVKTGRMPTGLNPEEFNQIAQSRGLVKAPEEMQPVEETSLSTKAAQVGLFIPVTLANIISKGLSLAGINIGETTTKEVASTKIGKAAGLAVDAAAIAAAAYYAIGLIGGATAGATGEAAAVQTARSAVGSAAVKTGLLSKVAGNKLLTGLLISGYGVSYINGRISDLETSVVNQRETLTLISSAVQAGAISRDEAMLMFNDIEADINQTEGKMRLTSYVSPKAWLGKGKEVETRLEKARTQLLVERAKLFQVQ